MIDDITLQKLRDLSIERVAEHLGLVLHRHTCCCLFHPDKHPSMHFNDTRHSFKCFVCGKSGGTIDLVMAVRHCSFREACDYLLSLTGESLPMVHTAPLQPPRKEAHPPDLEFLRALVAHPVLNEPARRFLFDERGLNPRVIEWLGISSIERPEPCWRYGKPFYDAPSLLFPYKDIDGRVMNVQSRYLGPRAEHDGSVPRFRFPPNGSVHVFNLPILRYLKPQEPLYLSEGITDCLALLSDGKRAIAIPSATSLKADDLLPLRGRELHIYPDRDEAGERLYGQLVRLSLDLGCPLVRHELPEGCKDYSEWRAEGNGVSG